VHGVSEKGDAPVRSKMSSDIAGDAKCNHWWAKRLNQTGISLEYFEFSTRKGITVVRIAI